MHRLNLGLNSKCSLSWGLCSDWLYTFPWSNVLMCVMIHQMANSWMCGSVWLVSNWAPLSSSGSMRRLSPSPTGTHPNQSNPLRILAVSSTLEWYICVPSPCVQSFCQTCVVHCQGSVLSLFIWGLENQTYVHSPQSHGWRIGNCSQRLPFMCQKKGEVKESLSQAGCPPEGVSIV